MAANRMLFLNLPVQNLKRSMEFFSKLGFEFNPQFTNDDAASMVIGSDAYAMLLTHERFKDFAKRPIADPKKTTTGLYAIGVKSRAEVEQMVKNAVENGGSYAAEKQDHGFMFGWSFYDPDGHHWEVFWMDPSHVQKQQ